MKKIFCFSITALIIVSAPAQINKPVTGVIRTSAYVLNE